MAPQPARVSANVMRPSREPRTDLPGREADGRTGIPDHRLSDRRDRGRHAAMAEVEVFYDREGKTLTVWFTEPSREYVCEETDEEVPVRS
jgi:hypothetical protein